LCGLLPRPQREKQRCPGYSSAIANNCDPKAALGKLGNSAKPSPWLRNRTIVKSEKMTSAAASEQLLAIDKKKSDPKVALSNFLAIGII